MAQCSGNFILVGTHEIPVTVLVAKAANYVRTEASFGWMTHQTANVTSTSTIAKNLRE
jgi:hypothetical protein